VVDGADPVCECRDRGVVGDVDGFGGDVIVVVFGSE
jgi:hypothetical protein